MSINTIRYVAQTFKGVEHRIEFVREVDGVSFYNNSIGTSPTRTIASLKAFNRKSSLLPEDMIKTFPMTKWERFCTIMQVPWY